MCRKKVLVLVVVFINTSAGKDRVQIESGIFENKWGDNDEHTVLKNEGKEETRKAVDYQKVNSQS